MNISFEKVGLKYIDTIFEWLGESHMVEFWDNSQEHKDDIVHFVNGRKGSAPYYDGIFDYWVGLMDNTPYSFFLTSEMLQSQNGIPVLFRDNLSKTGKTITIDFGIGNKNFLGKGYAASTLEAFVDFYYNQVDKGADTFFIDPDENNPRAKHVYNKAGFREVGEYDMEQGFFKGNVSYLMVKRIYKH